MGSHDKKAKSEPQPKKSDKKKGCVSDWKHRSHDWRNSKKYKALTSRSSEENQRIKQNRNAKKVASKAKGVQHRSHP